MTDVDELRARLADAGARKAAAVEEHERAIADIAAAVREGQAAGLQIKEMAELAGVSRTTVYALLDDDQ